MHPLTAKMTSLGCACILNVVLRRYCLKTASGDVFYICAHDPLWLIEKRLFYDYRCGPQCRSKKMQAHPVSMFVEHYVCETTVRTTVRRRPGVRCDFPFRYHGNNLTYYECTTVDNRGVPWCMTETGGYGECRMDTCHWSWVYFFLMKRHFKTALYKHLVSNVPDTLRPQPQSGTCVPLDMPVYFLTPWTKPDYSLSKFDSFHVYLR